MKALLYCTKSRPYLVYGTEMETDQNWHDKYCLTRGYSKDEVDKIWSSLNGFIVAECDIDKVEEIACTTLSNGVGFDTVYDTDELDSRELLHKSCIADWYLAGYLGVKDEQVVGYALYLSNIEVFDEPKEIYDYNGKGKDFKCEDYIISNVTYTKTQAPQNMCNVYDRFDNHYVLISIKPEWICKILNGEKTIEVRKQILNCLKEMI